MSLSVKFPQSVQATAALTAIASLAACGGPTQQAYIERLGSDTTAVEAFTRTADGFVGDLVIRSPVTRLAHYEGILSAEGIISRLEVTWSTPAANPDGPGPEEFVVSFDGDSAMVERQTSDGTTTSRVASPAGTIPQIGKSAWSYALIEQAARQLIAAGNDSIPITFMNARQARPSSNAMTRRGIDTVTLSFFGSPMLARIDGDGRVLGVSGAETTMAIEGEMVAEVDVASLAADFAARDARGEGLGVPSPPATTRASVAGALIEVDYSRPAMRGRSVFGGRLVPYDAVWRTGANSATHFTTDRDLVMGGTRVPAGTYTLWSTFTAGSAHLIINSQTGQWGTAYDSSRDFARIEMTHGNLDDVVERFTITVEETEAGGALSLRWDRSQFSVPFVVR